LRNENDWLASLSSGVETVAGLTAVDGATVISDKYDVLAFGATIRRAIGREQVEQNCAYGTDRRQ